MHYDETMQVDLLVFSQKEVFLLSKVI